MWDSQCHKDKQWHAGFQQMYIHAVNYWCLHVNIYLQFLRVVFGLQMDPLLTVGELRCMLIRHGVVCVMMDGTVKLEMWFVNNLDSLMQKLCMELQDLALVLLYDSKSVSSIYHYGCTGAGPVLLDDVRCSGTETNLLSCNHNGIGKQNCIPEEAASVTCRCKLEQCSLLHVVLIQH